MVGQNQGEILTRTGERWHLTKRALPTSLQLFRCGSLKGNGKMLFHARSTRLRYERR